jgi:hypothetical protein
MDRITQSLLAEFSQEVAIESLPENERFEHFGAYLAISRFLSETFDTRDVVFGSGNDTGIDAVATIVNGVLVTDPEMVEELATTNGYIDATFIFIQAERSPGFTTSKIGQFGFGVIDFFKETPTLPRNDAVKAAAEIMTEIYNRSSKFKRGNPICRAFYITTGIWVGDLNLETRRKAVVEDLRLLNLFREVEFQCFGADVIQKLFQQTKNAIARDFTFAERVILPEIAGVKEAYLGLLPINEFLTLLDDGGGEILKGIFYDNVRDWQEYNAVNSEMKVTLESTPQQPRFPIMNNGVTIIAKTILTTGNKCHIEDYQIVNGCQTSHVLFDNRQILDDKIVVPLRLIATNDEDVIASVVKATNRQTEVKEEQLLALSDFQKQLETYFQTFEPPARLYYERRSRQYNSLGVEKTRIVTPASLIRAYASTFLEEPHRTTRTYGALLAQLGTKIFVHGDRLEPYYYAASVLYRIEFLFRNGQLDSKFKPARYHVLMAARLLVQRDSPPPTNSHAMEKYCEPLIQTMWDLSAADKLLLQAAAIVNTAAAGNFDRDQIRTQPFTEQVKQLVLLI